MHRYTSLRDTTSGDEKKVSAADMKHLLLGLGDVMGAGGTVRLKLRNLLGSKCDYVP